jgi:RecA-family ATPase
VQRGFLYSNTAITGSGKTAILLLICAHVALRRPIGDIPVQQGRVMFFAGENPDDIRARWMAMAEHMDFDVSDIPVSFVAGVFNIPDMIENIQEDCRRNGELALVGVDTGAAYYIGDDDNNNVQMGNYARKLRSSLTTLPGKPTVVVNMHPTKNASANSDNLVPRGGGALPRSSTEGRIEYLQNG